MHVHVIPRRPGDFQRNDDIYEEVCGVLAVECNTSIYWSSMNTFILLLLLIIVCTKLIQQLLWFSTYYLKRFLK